MHSTSGPYGTVFLHNGDHSGAIGIILRDSQATVHAAPFSTLATAVLTTTGDATLSRIDVRAENGLATGTYVGEPYPIDVPAADLRRLIANRIMTERISALEQARDDHLIEAGRNDEIARWAQETA